MGREIFIHVGYRKTASTWLQKNLFSSHPDINHLGKPRAEIFSENIMT
jgi:hypothetical protein